MPAATATLLPWFARAAHMPVLARELRIATRKRSTFWLRVACAFAGVVIGAAFLFFQAIAGNRMNGVGANLFYLLTSTSLAAALLAGPFLTSDSISEESREGTLGLLFLTDLRGIDVVLGKLAAASARVFYAILAVFPIIAVALTMGGVSGGAFFKTTVALVNAMVMSLLIGITCSSFSSGNSGGLVKTIGSLLVVTLAPMPFPGAVFISPLALYAAAVRNAPGFWGGALTQLLLCAGILSLAAYRTQNCWRNMNAGGKPARKRASHKTADAVSQASATREPCAPTPQSKKAIEAAPVAWLSRRELGAVRTGALVVTALLLVVAVLMGFQFKNVAGAAAWTGLFGFLCFLLYLWTAARATRFYYDLRKSGLLELLLATPLTAPELIRGHFQALAQSLWLPALLFLCAHVVGSAGSVLGARLGSVQGAGLFLGAGMALSAVMGACLVAANIVALLWFGAYAGLTSRTAGVAFLKTFAFVQVLPWFAITFLSGIAIFALIIPATAFLSNRNGPGMASAVPVLMAITPSALGIVKDLLFVLWCRKKLFKDMRALLADPPWSRGATWVSATPLVLAPAGDAPPVIEDRS